MKIIFATNNPHKLAEMSAALAGAFTLVSLGDAGFQGDIPETGRTLEANALQKAEYVFERLGLPVFSDDTGLEVDCLRGAPGVDTAHYCGSRDADANMAKLLREMRGCSSRNATFKTVVAFKTATEKHLFVGSVNGTIAREKRGNGGFGYDPVFVPEGGELTYAELGAEAKAQSSHRVRALKKLTEFLGNRG